MTRRWRVSGPLAALTILVLGGMTSGQAFAHPVRLGLLTLVEGEAGVVDMKLHLSGTEREPTGGRPVLPKSCRPTTTPEHIALLVHPSW